MRATTRTPAHRGSLTVAQPTTVARVAAANPRRCVRSPPGQKHPPPPSAAAVTAEEPLGPSAERATVDAAVSTSVPSTAASFNWLDHWYPVAALDSLHTHRPNQVWLLGQRLVVWRDAGGTWRAFADYCPHRGVPLSEGRLEKDGTLACAYHGWRFDPSGACVDVPQAIGPDAVAAATQSPRACAAAHPAAARPDGLLWVWPVAGDAAFEKAAATPTGAPALSENDPLWMAHWFVRDVAFGVQELLENVADPTHVAHSHHGILGSRYSPPWQEFPAGEVEADPATTGFTVKGVLRARARTGGPATPAPPPAPPGTPRTLVEWAPPTQVHYSFGANGGSHMLTYSVPTTPGRARIFFSVLREKEGTPRAMAAALRLVGLPLFRWKQHAGNNAVLSGDNVLCGAQTALMDALAREGKTFRSAFHTPTSADAAVVRLRAWFERAPPIPWAPTSPPPPPPPGRYELLERLESHTKVCSHCSKALRAFTAARAAGVAGAAAGAVWAIAARAAGRAVPPAVLVGVAAAAAIAAAAHREVAALTFLDYVHQDKH